MQSGIYEGFVRHRRFEPTRHEFRSRLFMMYLDLGELPIVFSRRWFWSVERSNVATFRRRDHVGDIRLSLDETIRDLVHSQIGNRPIGPIRLLTNLTYFGYCFNPLSIYFCFDETGQNLHSIVAEVTNTPWGERHCYVLQAKKNENADRSEKLISETGGHKHQFRFAKMFHVSPFMQMDFEYRWHLSGPNQRLVLHTENWRDAHSMFDATLNLERREITTWSLASMLLRYPLMTVQVIATIHWQALWLWWKKIPYVPHPKTSKSENSANDTENLTNKNTSSLK